MMLASEIAPTVIVVLPFPAPLNVAVFPAPGTGEVDQLVVVDQDVSVAPVHEAFTAFADGESENATRHAESAAQAGV